MFDFSHHWSAYLFNTTQLYLFCIVSKCSVKTIKYYSSQNTPSVVIFFIINSNRTNILESLYIYTYFLLYIVEIFAKKKISLQVRRYILKRQTMIAIFATIVTCFVKLKIIRQFTQTRKKTFLNVIMNHIKLVVSKNICIEAVKIFNK